MKRQTSSAGGPRRGATRSRAAESLRPERLDGRTPVHEALRARRRRVHRIWATTGAAREEWLRAERVEPATGAELLERCGSPDHQGVVAHVDPYPYADLAALVAKPDPLLVALDEVQDPQNVGAICRTAEAAGATGLVLPERRAAHVTPAVAKASAGAVEHLPIAIVRNLADALRDAREAGCWVYGAAAGARTSYDTVDWRGGVVLVLGGEGRGLRARVAASCDDLVSLPLRGRIESLNVSATAAVLLYAALQGRSQEVDSGRKAP
jgi:23S rRNA (guanosine2251-2'-O)-methyltransferase